MTKTWDTNIGKMIELVGPTFLFIDTKLQVIRNVLDELAHFFEQTDSKNVFLLFHKTFANEDRA
jgi:hypothetical protein